MGARNSPDKCLDLYDYWYIKLMSGHEIHVHYIQSYPAWHLATLPTAHLRSTAGQEGCHPRMAPATGKGDTHFLFMGSPGSYEF